MTATDVERMAYAAAMAKAEKIIRYLGGDPKHPTPEQARIAAKILLAPVARASAGKTNAEIDKLVASAAELLREIEAGTH